MTTTVNHSRSPSEGWGALSSAGAANVLVALKTPGPVLVYVGASAPTGGAANDGVVLASDGDVSWSGSQLESGDIVFWKAIDTRGDDRAQTVSVMASTAP